MFIINPKGAFNDLFKNIDQKLASQIPNSSKTFETYINKLNNIMDSNIAACLKQNSILVTI